MSSKRKPNNLSSNLIDITCERKHKLNLPEMIYGGISEQWLLKELGDMHWTMISKSLGTDSDEIVDENGQRLLASFVRVKWRANGNLSEFKENENVLAKGEMSVYSKKFFLSDTKLTKEDKTISASLMTVFSLRSNKDNKQLVGGKPINVKNIKGIQHKKFPRFAKEFIDLKGFAATEKKDAKTPYVTLDDELFSHRRESIFSKRYRVDPYDDINGVGLLYFASYPRISDKCEWYFFQGNCIGNEDFNWAANSVCVARDVHYYGNANVNEEIRYELNECRFIDDRKIRLTASLYREKDGVLIASVFTIKDLLQPIQIACPIEKKVANNAVEAKHEVATDFANGESTPERDDAVFADAKTEHTKYTHDGLTRDVLNNAIIEFFNEVYDRRDIDLKTDLRDLGVESIILTELSEYLHTRLNIVSNPSRFFGLFSIEDITIYILGQDETAEENPETKDTAVLSNDDIAVVGVSFRIPGANDMDTLWKNLKDGVSSISKISKDRWEWPEWVDLEGKHLGVDSGGLIEDIDKFDPLFFGISAREAELMDPQQRIMLELSWELLERSGHKPSSLRGSTTGVFIGVSGSDYEVLLKTASGEEAMTPTGTAQALLANRLSYFYDLKGPSLTLDTACSSSLVAIDEAIKSILQDQCNQAIVGGVHIMCEPSRSLAYRQANMLSPDGKCQTFDQKANGYVRGEGAIVLMLKRASEARLAKDSIYAVIKGTAVNHGGYSGGLTVPNPNKQQELIETAYEKANVPISSISYLEAHGTGTSLGDPIEVTGLTMAFQKLLKDSEKVEKPWCGIGSIKTNIGHLEAAAGMAGMLKVMLAMQQQVIPKTINFDKLNPKVELSQSPFYLQQENTPWLAHDGKPLRAGVSSFGIGGSNAHVVMESYENNNSLQTYEDDGPFLFVLSAKNGKQLTRYASSFIRFIDHHPSVNPALLAYTLQMSREAMEYRLAVIFDHVTQLKTVLNSYINGSSDEQYYTGDIKSFHKFTELLDNENNARTCIEDKKFQELCQYWVAGGSVDWGLLYPDKILPKLTNLPTYPFSREVYWLPAPKAVNPQNSQRSAWLHPMLHTNVSDLKSNKYKSVYTGKEEFLSHHLVQGNKVLPGVAYLEIIRAAARQSLGSEASQLTDIIWPSPLIVTDKEKEVQVKLHEVNGQTVYEIFSEVSGKTQLHGQGKLLTASSSPSGPHDLSVIRIGLAHSYSGQEVYTKFHRMGLSYGARFRGIQTLSYNASTALSEINLPQNEYPLSTGILDCALQTCLAIDFDTGILALPFSIKKVSWHKDVAGNIWCYARKTSNGQKEGTSAIYDVDLIDGKGNVLVRFDQLVVLPAGPLKDPGLYAVKDTSQPDLTLYSQLWKANAANPLPLASGKTVILMANEGPSLNDLISLSFPAEVHTLKAGDGPFIFTQVLDIVRSYMVSDDAVRILFVCDHEDRYQYGFVSGLMKTAHLEQQKLLGKTVFLEGLKAMSPSKLADILEEELHYPDTEVRYLKGVRETSYLHELPANSQKTSSPIKSDGVYLITGGMGGLGLLFAKHIGKTRGAKVILTGRSALNHDKQKLVEALPYASYLTCDVSDQASVVKLIKGIKDNYGRIDGIIHAAGVLRDSFIVDKTAESVHEVLSPKVMGAQHLAKATADEALDFLVFFSSVVGVLGNIGQVDYAAANAYLDQYANLLQTQFLGGERAGRTVSINWPLWREGGMQINEEEEKYLLRQWGMSALPTAQGLSAFDAILNTTFSQVLVACGDKKEFSKALVQHSPPVEMSKSPKSNTTVADKEDVLNKVLSVASDLLKFDVADIMVDEPLGDYGFDSIMFTRFCNELNDFYGTDLMPTVFYNHNTLDKLVDYLFKEYPEQIVQFDETAREEDYATNIDIPSNSGAAQDIEIQNVSASIDEVGIDEEIAIVGLSGRFPGSPDLDTFWKNLDQNRDMITEIPGSRWNWRDYYGDPLESANKTKAKWGGFISDIDKFDPLFFGISPKEAELMDPQQRIALQASYHALEDAGISPESIKGSNTGVFIGVSTHDYLHLLNRQARQGIKAQYSTGTAYSVLANRVSYLLDLHGPSEPIDTACSSSLVAIHRAVENLKNGHCDVALAGGVNAILSPEYTLSFSHAGMLSDDGRCKVFDQSANGYVRGEGVGMIVLKPLKSALEDGNSIYGIVKSTAQNHGGKANTLTSPNYEAQSELLLKAYRSAAIDPRDVSYIETHGTGTSLGDPVEIEGLKLAFKQLYDENGLGYTDRHIALGSVKANIGHLEAAAGIAGVIKVLLSMKYGRIPGNPHLKQPNEYLKLTDSPFRLQQSTTDWDSTAGKPRIAGVSSFGFGGSNAHIVLQEHLTVSPHLQEVVDQPYVIVISAKNEQRLQKQVSNLLEYAKGEGVRSLRDIAYTLQVGRTAMEERLAFIVASIDALIERLEDYLHSNTDHLIRGNIRKAKASLSTPDKTVAQKINTSIQNHSLAEVAEYWVQGFLIDWVMLYDAAGSRPRLISLPTYPFEKKRYWLDSYEHNGAQPLNHQLIRTDKMESFWDSEEVRQSKSFVIGEEVKLTLFDNGVALVKMEDRASKNLISQDLVFSLQKTFLELRQNKDLKVVVLTGYDNIFCMGGSQDMLENIANKKARFTDYPFLYFGLLTFDIPVITAMQGHAFGGGMLFGLYGDIVLLGEKAIYTANFMKYGFTPGMGATYILGEKLGKPLANEMMFTANQLTGQDIKERGASIIVAPDALKEALKIANQLSSKPRKSLELLKQKISRSILSELDYHIQEEEKMHEQTFHTNEVMSEITSSFTGQPRKPEASQKVKNDETQHSADNPQITLAPLEELSTTQEDDSIGDNSVFKLQELETNHGTDPNIIKSVRQLLSDVVHIPVEELEADIAFVDLGLDSISGVELIRAINKSFDVELEAVILYDYHTLNDLAAHIGKVARNVHPAAQPSITEHTLAAPAHKVQLSTPSTNENDGYVVADIRSKLETLLEDLLHISKNDIQEDVALMELGLDSISGVELIRSINKIYDIELEAVILYDYSTINLLASAIAATLPVEMPGDADSAATAVADVTPVRKDDVEQHSISEANSFVLPEIQEDIDNSNRRVSSNPHRSDDIAIIGVSGRFPEADTIGEYWENLKSGKDSIKEVPSRKWSLDDVYSSDKDAEGKSYAKWMGSIDDEDKFDPLFFNISPMEAERMDPQQRLLLQESWKAIEDAGYRVSALSEKKCGVFIGVSESDYHDGIQDKALDAHTFTGRSASILAGRISYHFNLTGPALSIDTACSSSLVAIHQACQSIKMGDCETALAGGVYVMTSPKMHIETSKSGMLSEDGKCFTFCQRANGFVPGEAVGVLLLKSLRQAEKDGDNIYAVIRGSGTNQDGKTNGITAPSAASQTRLIKEVYDNAGIDPSTITYVEAHGTGTKLGDPIEIKALKDAFGTVSKSGYCGVGSVKTNIGHTLMAAGAAGVIKVALSLKHKQIPPTLNYNKLNEHIRLEGSPFYICDSLRDWDTSDHVPRRAAVSSFGFSGTNSHIVLEEYATKATHRYNSKAPAVIVLSAKDKDRLRDHAANLVKYFGQESAANIQDVAYTLQIGREPMEERLAFLAQDITTATEKLNGFLEGKQGEVFTENGKKESWDRIISGPAGSEYLRSVMKHQQFDVLVQLWVNGVAVDWNMLYVPENRPSKVSLPTYPFAKERYWMESYRPGKLSNSTPSGHKQHLLLHTDVSTLGQFKYESRYMGSESFLKDHVVQDKRTYPGVAYLELAREAGERSLGSPVTELKHIAWLKPLTEGKKGIALQVEVFEKEEESHFVVKSTSAIGETIHAQGTYSRNQPEPCDPLDVEAIRKRLHHRKNKALCYQFFSSLGLDYGPSFQGVEELYYNEEEALSKISLPVEENCFLSPGLLDSALQTCIAFDIDQENKVLRLPFSANRVSVYKKVDSAAWCYTRKSAGSQGKVHRYDLDLLTSEGEVALSIREFTLLPLPSKTSGSQISPTEKFDKPQLAYYKTYWKEIQLSHPLDDRTYSSGLTLIVGKESEFLAGLKSALEAKGNKVLVADDLEGASVLLPDVKKLFLLQGLDPDADMFSVDKIFRSVKKLQASNCLNLEITVLIHNSYRPMNDEKIDPAGAGVVGLVGSLAKESPGWDIRLIDVDIFNQQAIDKLLHVPFSTEGNLHALSKGKCFERQLISVDTATLPSKGSRFRKSGTYVILGGAGGLGKVTTEHLIREHNARVYWLGRRPLDDEISSAIHELGKLGQYPPEYIQCNANDARDMVSAANYIKSKGKDIHGIFHSALVLHDMAVFNMQYDDFRRGFDIKALATRNLVNAFKDEPLDFICFYSSVQSFICFAGQSNYAAGCTYQDSYARFVEQQSGIPSFTINWGYWGDVGVVSSTAYQDRMSQMGIGGIQGVEGMDVLEHVLTSGVRQLAILKHLNAKGPEILKGHIAEDRKITPQPSNSAIRMAKIKL